VQVVEVVANLPHLLEQDLTFILLMELAMLEAMELLHQPVVMAAAAEVAVAASMEALAELGADILMQEELLAVLDKVI
jgi:hypothetical protein